MTIELTKEQLEQYERDGELTIKAPKEKKEFPQIRDKYWCIGSDGHIFDYMFSSDHIDIGAVNYGNIYQTADEAIKARDIQLAKTRVKRAIAKANDGWEPDWDDIMVTNYMLTYDSDMCKFAIEPYRYMKSQPNWIYMKSEEIAEQILEEYKKDLELIFSE